MIGGIIIIGGWVGGSVGGGSVGGGSVGGGSVGGGFVGTIGALVEVGSAVRTGIGVAEVVE